MKFTRPLNPAVAASLSSEDRFEYRKYYESICGESLQEYAGSWSFEDWCNYARTKNNFTAAGRNYVSEEDDITHYVSERLNATGSEIEKFTYFWETASPFSQWHRSAFIAPSYIRADDFSRVLTENGFSARTEFSSAEQYMMYAKAMLFVDLDAAQAILAEHDPRKVKALGRSVRWYREETWQTFRWELVAQGNRCKFEQNPGIKEELLATRGTTIVEASPHDKIWGIGLRASDEAAAQRATWQGKNLLGEVLTQLRVELAGGY